MTAAPVSPNGLKVAAGLCRSRLAGRTVQLLATSKPARFASLLPAVACLVGAAFIAQAKLSATLLRAGEPIPSRSVATSPASSATAWRLLSLGHYEAAADLLWLNALSQFGQTHGLARNPRWMDQHIDAVIGVDPRYRIVYEWAGTIVMYGSLINNDSVNASNRHLERGLERFPGDSVLLSMLAVNYLFEYQPVNAADKERAQRLGRQALIAAASTPEASSTIRLAAATIARKSGSRAEAFATARAGLLADDGADQVRSLRTQLGGALRGPELHALLQERQVLVALRNELHWGALAAETSLQLHPEPRLLFSASELAIPTIDEAE